MTWAMNEGVVDAPRACEVQVWDGGEWVYCHGPAVRRLDLFPYGWVCAEHTGEARDEVIEGKVTQ